MSHGEMEALRKTGQIHSRGRFNLGESQVGLTFYSTQPDEAVAYAGNYAPWQFRPTFDRPAYLVGVRRPPAERTRQTPGSPFEVGVEGAIPASDIVSVTEVRPYAISDGRVTAAPGTEYGLDTSDYVIGGAKAPRTYLAYRSLTPSDVLEEAYLESQHPRSRTGQWKQKNQGHPAKPRRRKKRTAPRGRDGGAITLTPSTPATPKLPEVHLPSLAPEVAAIDGPEAMDAYLASLGIEGHMSPTEGISWGPYSAEWYQEIAQAVHDAVAEFPVLREGPVPLGLISLRSKADDISLSDVSRAKGIYAVTTFAPARGQVGIVFNDLTAQLNQRHSGQGVSPAGVLDYGLVMHELGHAVADASGLSWAMGKEDVSAYGTRLASALDAVGLTPDVVGQLSEYGATSPVEAWAEIFSTLHTPGAMERVEETNPTLAGMLRRLQAEHGTYNGYRVL
jgi:hypothetical protein